MSNIPRQIFLDDNNDSIEVGQSDPYKLQQERIMALLEAEIQRKQIGSKLVMETTQANRLLEQATIEQKNVIRDLKAQMMALLTVPTREGSTMTEESSLDIDKELSIVRPFHEKYEDLYPQLNRSASVDKERPHEFEFYLDTMQTCLKEAGLTYALEDAPATISDSLSTNSNNSNEGYSPYLPSPEKEKLVTVELLPKDIFADRTEEVPKKEGFAWGSFFKRISPSITQNEPKGQKVKTAEQSVSEFLKRVKEWEKIATPVFNGENIWIHKQRMNGLLEGGVAIPYRIRGLIWRKCLGNRSRITGRIFQMLLAQLKDANPEVHHRISQDVSKVFPQFSESKTFKEVQDESIKILQMFELHRPDMGYVKGMAYIAVGLRMNMSTFNSFKALCGLLYGSDFLYATYTFDTAKVLTRLTLAKQVLRSIRSTLRTELP